PGWPAITRDRRAENELPRLVFIYLVFAARELDVAEALFEVRDLLRIGRVEGDELTAAALHGRGHAVDVRVVEPDDAEPNRVLRRLQRRALRDFVRDLRIAGLREHCRRERRSEACESGSLQERASIGIGHRESPGLSRGSLAKRPRVRAAEDRS